MGLLTLTDEMLAERLGMDNPWWSSGHVDEYYRSMQQRLYFDVFFPLVKEISIRRAVILMGPRRVGKTVMILHAIEALIRSGVSPRKIAYISVENPFFNNLPLEYLFKVCRNCTGQQDPKGWYVFFDEVQYLKDWEVHLKTMVDSYLYTKLIASGSSAAALKLKSNESGAGRFTDFMLPPLTFYEYIHLLKLQDLIIPSKLDWNGNAQEFFASTSIGTLNDHFIRYINYGGYPEIIFSETLQSSPSRYIRNDIIDKVLLKDLPSLYGIQDVQELNSFFTSIAYNSGQEFSLEELSRNSGGVKKETLKKYLQYLEAAFLIKIIHRIDHHARKFERANYFKIYLTNPSLRSAIFAPLRATDELIGPMVETAIYAQWLQREWFEPKYARWNEGRNRGEVDMVGLSQQFFKPIWALEIKWSNRYLDKPNELKSLLTFCELNELESALVTTIDKTGEISFKGKRLYFLPAALYAYVVGRNTIVQKYGKATY